MVDDPKALDKSSLAAVFESLPEPALVIHGESVEPVGRVALANQAARERFGLSQGQPMLVQVIRRPEVLDLVEASLAHGASGEVAWQSADDRNLTAIVRPLPPPGRGERLALLLLRDETAVRRTERMRADFLANASHELRTPLASLTGFIETLRGHARDDPAARERFLAVMADQAERMGRLIADLMSLSRIELDEHVPPSGRADLAALARSAADGLQPIAEAAGARIELAGAQEALVVGDERQLVQVLQNLMENAVKYGAGGRVLVEIAEDVPLAEAREKRNPAATVHSLLDPASGAGGPVVAVRISDEGAGIAREHLPRLSERFYRAPGQKHAETPGTGLGLAIVKHIVNRHRGGLFVESAPGEGAAFTVWLPKA